MGVLGLWQLLAPVGQPVTLESLENKIFAVDISIWLNQALKGYRDSQGGSVANAHLLSLFSRLCKLLFYKIRPIIVFDGGYPELKRQTIINRQQRRTAVKQSSRDVGLKILTNYLASQNLANAGSIDTSQPIIKHKEKVRDEIFKLPPLPDTSLDGGYEASESADLIEWKFTNFSKEDIKYLNQIDIDSDDFNSLPPDVKQEILSTLKESRKHKTWDQYEELPNESNEFSNYQMQCLLKKRNLQKKLEQAQKDLRQINSADFVAQYTNDHVIGETNKIMSDDCSHYVLLRKIIGKTVGQSKDEANETILSSSMIDTKNAFIKDMENIDVSGATEGITDQCNEFVDKNQNFNHVIVKQELDLYDRFEEEDVDDPLELIDKKNQTPNINSLSILRTLPTENIEISKVADGAESSLASENLNTLIFPKSPNDVTSKSGILLNRTENLSTGLKLSSPITSENHQASNNKHDEHSPNSNIINVESQSKCTKNFCTSEQKLSLNLMPENIPQNTSSKNDNLSSSEEDIISCDEDSLSADMLIQEKISSELLTKVDIIKPSSSIENSIENIDFHEKIPTYNLSKNSDVLNKCLDDEFETLSSSEMPSTSKESTLSKNENDLILKQLQNDLESATALLEADQAKQDRQNRTVQEHMVEECKELLQLFGIPFVVSPTEAEAQCAFYDIVNLSHGTITDDSDVWLFGGKRVYKNFFTQQKYVEFYKDVEVFNHFSLSRKKLINFAMLTGSDYTEGIEGVGPVTAMEILSEFPGEDLEALQKFKEWWSDVNKHIRSPENKVRAKLQKLMLSSNFPDEKVSDAYLNPVIDNSTEKFSWGRPDLDALREYTKERFGWNKSKVDDALLPVIKKLNEREAQTHLDSFFTINLKKQTELFPSKRIMSALKKMTSPQKDGSNEESLRTNSKRKSACKKTASKKPKRKITANEKKCRTKAQLQGPMLSEESSDDN